ncbi:hypothetical protein RR42_s2209 [Cupriavidus basilensis]|uniref:Uncharacterized protein n=1 Tax=Cupriavidus basilensis TaxID=68895 RepID=A0A0C4YT00_9BURK|nr:hypothetical protein RR42_s2209 [Cupriavidus basilensis]
MVSSLTGLRQAVTRTWSVVTTSFRPLPLGCLADACPACHLALRRYRSFSPDLDDIRYVIYQRSSRKISVLREVFRRRDAAIKPKNDDE